MAISFTNQLKKVTYERMVDFAGRLDLNFETDHFLKTYPILRTAISRLSFFSVDDFVIASSLVYSWMPTILTIHWAEAQRSLPVLRAIKDEQPVQTEELKMLKAAINNSVVGMSKLLHFVSPEAYPIWDSRVLAFILEKQPRHYPGYMLDNVENYLAYRETLINLAEDPRFRILRIDLSSRFAQSAPLSDLRLLELIMFKSSNSTDEL